MTSATTTENPRALRGRWKGRGLLSQELARLSGLPGLVGLIMAENSRAMPKPLLADGALSGCPIDHLAVAFETHADFQAHCRLMGELLPVIEAPHIWPEKVEGCPAVPPADRKYMASYRWVSGGQSTRIVLLAPCSPGDVIDTWITRAGKPDLHHVAVEVPDIKRAMEVLQSAHPDFKQITDLAVDEENLSQVFFKSAKDVRIFELVERVGDFDLTFTCKNVRLLTAGERENAFPTRAGGAKSTAISHSAPEPLSKECAAMDESPQMQTVRRYFDAQNESQAERVVDLFAEDAEVFNTTAPKAVGRAGVRKFCDDLYARTASRQFTIIDTAAGKDAVMAHWQADLVFRTGARVGPFVLAKSFSVRLTGVNKFTFVSGSPVIKELRVYHETSTVAQLARDNAA